MTQFLLDHTNFLSFYESRKLCIFRSSPHWILLLCFLVLVFPSSTGPFFCTLIKGLMLSIPSLYLTKHGERWYVSRSLPFLSLDSLTLFCHTTESCSTFHYHLHPLYLTPKSPFWQLWTTLWLILVLTFFSRFFFVLLRTQNRTR